MNGTARDDRICCICFKANQQSVPTRLKSHTNVHPAETASRTRTRQSDTRNRCTNAATHGHAQLSPDMTGLFMILLTGLAKLTSAATVAVNSHGRDVSLIQVSRLVVMHLDTPRTRTGRSVSNICKRCTSSENAGHRASSFARITLDGISSIVTQGQAGNGPTCLKMLVCWKRTQRLDKYTNPTIH